MKYKLKAVAKTNIIFNGDAFNEGQTINGVYDEKQIYQLSSLIDILEKTPLENAVKEMKPVTTNVQKEAKVVSKK